MHHFRNLKLKPERDADQPPLMTIDVEVEERKSHLDFPEGDLDRGDMGSNTKIRRPVGMKRRGNETKNITSRKIFDKFNNFEHE